MANSLVEVRERLQAGADPNSDALGGRALQVAARLGHLEIVDTLLKAGADVNSGNSVGTPLSEAIEKGHAEVALLLLAHGATPASLAAAAATGQTAVVRALLERGLPPDEPCRSHPSTSLLDFTPLLAACQAGHRETAEALLAAGASPHFRDGLGQDALAVATPEIRAWLAAQKIGSRQTPEERLRLAVTLLEVEEALRAGPDLDARDSRRAVRGRTALALAAAEGRLDVVNRLLQAGASPDLADADIARPGLAHYVEPSEPLGRTPLYWAAHFGHRGVVDALLAAGAPPRPDFLGSTPLHAAARNGHREVVQCLLQAGVPVDVGKPTPLLVALEARQRECALALLEAKASVKSAALIAEAAEMADPDLLRRMIARKAPLKGSKKSAPPLARVVGASRMVPLAEAPAGNWPVTVNEHGTFKTVPAPEEQILEATEVLLSAGAAVDEPGWLGTPLMVAARQGLTKVVRRLLEAGADPDLMDDEDTALSLAELFEHREVADILRPLTTVTPEEPDDEATSEEAPELPVPEFTETPELTAAVTELEALCGSRAFPQEYLEGGYELHVHSSQRAAFSTLEVQRRWPGCFVFEPEYARETETVAIVPTERWQDVLALRQTDGINMGLAPSQVLKWMEALERRHPFQLRTIAQSTLAGVFLQPIPDPLAMAREMYAFCPDIVDQGCETVEGLADQLRKSPPPLYFWWD